MSVQTPLDAIGALSPLFESHADAGAIDGALSAPVVEALHEAKLFGLWLPRSLGGLDLQGEDALRVIEALSYADGATGWVTMAGALSTATTALFLEDAAVREIFRPGERTPVVAGQGAPNGKGHVAPGGYVLSGRWNYGSGIKHAAYAHSGGLVIEENGLRRGKTGDAELRIYIVPTSEVDLQDNWDVIGLRATGSIDYGIDRKFVSDAYTHLLEADKPLRGGPLFTLGVKGVGSLGHTGFALGVSRRILDELAAIARKKPQINESESFLENYASAEAQLRSARAFAYDTWGEIDRKLSLGRDAATRDITLARLCLNHATSTSVNIGQFAYLAAGGQALRTGPLQRGFRDVLAGAQHITSSPLYLRECAKDLAGLAEGKRWGIMKLVDAE